MNSKIYSSKISDIKFTNRNKKVIAYLRKKEELKLSSLLQDKDYANYLEKEAVVYEQR